MACNGLFFLEKEGRINSLATHRATSSHSIFLSQHIPQSQPTIATPASLQIIDKLSSDSSSSVSSSSPTEEQLKFVQLYTSKSYLNQLKNEHVTLQQPSGYDETDSEVSKET